jgi:hypothetical protein
VGRKYVREERRGEESKVKANEESDGENDRRKEERERLVWCLGESTLTPSMAD